ncbi:MAG: energy transducer TonB [Rhodanobacteraceae bacterium]|nr:energy transducer TonB [Rhodanobacteraceae bacterium]MBK7043173.1 energy transducer TonB [Rhodanobacteraceae bacterium]MBP9154540.1 energy transducer TonB [Xanthomonadales bacterium]HQW80281.1 energy transducer TonB [Pseudomonadota bacterium]
MSFEIHSAPVRSHFRVATLSIACILAVAACGKKEETAAPVAGTQPAAGASPQVVAPAAPEVTVADLIAAAKRAESEERLVSPAADNAIEYYLQVLTKEANNVSATQALVDLFPLAVGNAEREISNRNLDEATRIVALLDQASPGSYTVSTLKSKLSAARTQVQREDERRVAQETAAQQREQAAAQAAATPAPVAPVQPARTVQAEPRPVETTPVQTEPVTPPPPAQPARETREPVLVRQVRPTYPAAAARRKQEGWVEVSFTVGTNGSVSNVDVVRAQPRGVFDRDATRAVAQWQFEPAMDNGKAVSRELTRRIEFALKAQ